MRDEEERDETELAMTRLMKRKAWPFAVKMIRALSAATPDAPVPTRRLRSVAGCSEKQTSMVIRTARHYFERIECTTLNNERAVGYFVGRNPTEQLNEASKTAQRGIGYLHNHATRMDLIDKKKITRLDDMQLYATNEGMRCVSKALFELEGTLRQHLIQSTNAKERMAHARKEAQAPLEAFGLADGVEDEDPGDGLMQCARAPRPSDRGSKL